MTFRVGDLVTTVVELNYGIGEVVETDATGVKVDFPDVFGTPTWFLPMELSSYEDWEADALELVETVCYGHDAQKDAVNSPDHYNHGEIECIDYLKDNMSWEGYTGYLEGNCKKYMHRWRYKKKPLEDLNKARWYLDRLISELTEEET